MAKNGGMALALWAATVLCMLRGGSGYLIEGGFGAREVVQPADPYPGLAPRPTLASKDAAKSFFGTHHVLGSVLPIDASAIVEAEFPDVASEVGAKLDRNSTWQRILVEGGGPEAAAEKENVAEAPEGGVGGGGMFREGDWTEEEERAVKAGSAMDVEGSYDGATGMTEEQREAMVGQLLREEAREDEWGNRGGVAGDSAAARLLGELRLRDGGKVGNGSLTARQLLDLGYQAYGGRARSALKAEAQEAPLIGDGRPRKEEPRTLSGRVRHTLIAGDHFGVLEEWVEGGGMEGAVREELLMREGDVTEVGQRTYVDKNGTMYVGLASPMHPASQAAAVAGDGAGAVAAAEGVAWSDVRANVTALYSAMEGLYGEWEGRRETAGLVRGNREGEGGGKGGGVLGGEEASAADRAAAKEAERMMRAAGRDGTRISSDARLLPWWLRRRLAFLATPAREALRVASLLAVIVSFGAGVEYANLMLKGPRRTTPRPVRTTTGLPY